MMPYRSLRAGSDVARGMTSKKPAPSWRRLVWGMTMTTTSVILLDVSSSMSRPVAGGQRRIDVLAAILKNVVTPDVRLIAFNDSVFALEHGQPLPEPDGSTALHLALDHASRLSPRRVIVISDGQPDDGEMAIAAARSLCCVINTFHCGDETDRGAVAFMKRLSLLSRGGVGRPQIANLHKPEKLAGELRLLLAAPAP